MTLRVFQTLKVLPRSLSQGRVVTGSFFDWGVDAVVVVFVVGLAVGVVGVGRPAGDGLHHDADLVSVTTGANVDVTVSMSHGISLGHQFDQ